MFLAVISQDKTALSYFPSELLFLPSRACNRAFFCFVLTQFMQHLENKNTLGASPSNLAVQPMHIPPYIRPSFVFSELLLGCCSHRRHIMPQLFAVRNQWRTRIDGPNQGDAHHPRSGPRHGRARYGLCVLRSPCSLLRFLNWFCSCSLVQRCVATPLWLPCCLMHGMTAPGCTFSC